MFWFTKWWVNNQLWDDITIEELRPTENAAFMNLRKQSLYGVYLRRLSNG